MYFNLPKKKDTIIVFNLSKEETIIVSSFERLNIRRKYGSIRTKNVTKERQIYGRSRVPRTFLQASQNSVRECRGKVQAKLCSGESGRGSDTSGTFTMSDKRCFDQAVRHALKDIGCI